LVVCLFSSKQFFHEITDEDYKDEGYSDKCHHGKL